MPRKKIMSDEEVLQAGLDLIHSRGPDALTFASLSKSCGLSPATLVQRFRSKEQLKQSALLLAWDQLDARTRALAKDTPRAPQGAIAMLVGLSRGYGGIEAYAEGLLVLREDFRDPALRARGARWKQELSHALDACFAGCGKAPAGIGLLMAAQWQGALLWWAFEPVGKVEDFVAESLKRFVAFVTSESDQAEECKETG